MMVAVAAAREVANADLAPACAALAAAGARLLSFFGADERDTRGGFALYAVFLQGGATTLLRAAVDPARPAYPAVTRLLPAVHWDEREVHDLLGIVPEGHPDPRPLVRRADWPAGVFPLRKDFDPRQLPPPGRADSFDPTPVEGEGVVSLPVGPIHAGIIEPGHFRFAVVGEVVLQLDARLFYTHRGIEKLAEGRPAEQVLQLAERTCGVCALSHAVAFAEAVEGLAGAVVPPRARWARSLLLELERLYNHLGDVGNICAGVGLAVGTSQGARLKERVQRLNERLVGHRFLRGICTVGGLRRDLAADDLAGARAELARLRDEALRFAELLAGSESLRDRVVGTGALSAATVEAFGGVGVAARAAGVDYDLRRDRPYAFYPELAPVAVPLGRTGDVAARMQQRLAEAEESFRLLDLLLGRPPSGPVRVKVAPPPAGQVGVGAVESPRGADVHSVLFAADGTVARYRVRSASFPNWPLVALAVPGNLVPDFPLINKSFELCYACVDR